MRFNPVLERLSPYHSGPSLDEIREQYHQDEIVQLSANEIPWGPFPEVIERVKDAVGGLNRYPDGSSSDLKTLLAKRLGVTEHNLCLGNGSCELLMLLGQVFLSPQHHAVLQHPSFVMYQSIALTHGGPYTLVPLKDLAVDLDAMRAALESNTSLVIVCNPNNPTGGYIGTEGLRAFLKEVPEDVAVVLDEAYVEFVTSSQREETARWVEEYRNLIVLRTFSKIYGLAGLRVGYAIADPDVIHALDKVRQPFNVDSLAQVAATESLLHPDRVAERRTMIATEKERVAESLERLGIGCYRGEANFLLVDVTGLGVPGPAVGQELLSRGVLTRSGYAMDCPGWIRVTIGDERQNDLFLEAMRGIYSGERKADIEVQDSAVKAESLSPES